jgi:hypothetical protein
MTICRKGNVPRCTLGAEYGPLRMRSLRAPASVRIADDLLKTVNITSLRRSFLRQLDAEQVSLGLLGNPTGD